MFEQLGVIGCGLMGCSFALAAKKAGLVKRVVGYSKSPTTTESAKAAGILDETAPSALQAVSGSDLVLIAVPVGEIPSIFTNIVSLIAPDTLVMDVGSTKQDVVEAARRCLKKKVSNFVPAHPIAGKNLAGFRAAEENLFEKTKVVLTPIDETKQTYLDNAIKIWQAIGAKVQLMDPQYHDTALGAVSHFPHLLASAYMSDLITHPDGARFLSLAGEGFRDFTRIASSEPNLWCDVFLANKKEMLLQISSFKRMLGEYEKRIQKDDALALLNMLTEASKARAAWSLGDSTLFASHSVGVKEPKCAARSGFLDRLFSNNKTE